MSKGNNASIVGHCVCEDRPIGPNCLPRLFRVVLSHGYCFPGLLWYCQHSLNLLITFHHSGPEPQNACSALPCRQGSDSLFFFLKDVSLTGSWNTDPVPQCWGSLTARSMRAWIFSTGSNIFNIFSLSLNRIHGKSVMPDLTCRG